MNHLWKIKWIISLLLCMVHDLIQDRIAEGILASYSNIYESIIDPANEYDDPGYSLKHNPDHLKTVLGI